MQTSKTLIGNKRLDILNLYFVEYVLKIISIIKKIKNEHLIFLIIKQSFKLKNYIKFKKNYILKI